MSIFFCWAYVLYVRESSSRCNTMRSEPILQWRKLSGDTSRNKDTPWISNKTPHVDNQRASTQEVKVSRQDFINEEGRRRREHSTKKTHTSKSCNEKKTHVTQHKKAQYTHLVSNRGGLAKNGDRPKVYSSIRKEDNDKKQAKTGLWLNEFTVAD